MARPRAFDHSTVVEAAMETFWSKGYQGASTEDLCASTGLARGSLYNAFGSKHKLYEEALNRYSVEGLTTQLAILDEPGPVLGRLRTLLETAVETDLASDERRGCLIVNAAVEAGGADQAVTRRVRRHFGVLEDVVTDLIAEGRRSGELRGTDEPRQAARTFLSGYYGLRVLGKFLRERPALMEVVEGSLARL